MKKIFLLLIAIFLLGCSATSNKKNDNPLFLTKENVIGTKRITRTRPLDEPEWTTSTHRIKKEYPQYELFVGISTFVPNERDAVRMAEQDAIQKIITYLGTYGENNFKEISTNSSIDFNAINAISQDRISQISRNYTEGIKTLETYTEWGERYSPKQIWENYVLTYVLYGLERENYKEAQKEIIGIQKTILKEKASTERNKNIQEDYEKAIRELEKLTE